MVFRYLIASSCHFLNEWIRFSPLGASTASESGENDSDLCTWLIAVVLIVLLISCSSNCIWGEIRVLVNSSTLEPRVMPFGNVTMSSVSPLRHKPAKSSAPKVFGLLVWSVTLVCEMQTPNCLFLNKLSFNMPKASFIEQEEGRGKQKSVGGGCCPDERWEREMCFGESGGLEMFYGGKPRQTEVREDAIFLPRVSLQAISTSCLCNQRQWFDTSVKCQDVVWRLDWPPVQPCFPSTKWLSLNKALGLSARSMSLRLY